LEGNGLMVKWILCGNRYVIRFCWALIVVSGGLSVLWSLGVDDRWESSFKDSPGGVLVPNYDSDSAWSSIEAPITPVAKFRPSRLNSDLLRSDPVPARLVSAIIGQSSVDRCSLQALMELEQESSTSSEHRSPGDSNFPPDGVDLWAEADRWLSWSETPREVFASTAIDPESQVQEKTQETAQQEEAQGGLLGRLRENRSRLRGQGGMRRERSGEQGALGDRLSNLVDSLEKRLDNGEKLLEAFSGEPSVQIVTAEAVVGQTYNVGHLIYRLTPEDALRWQSRAIFVSDAENRVLYPTLMPTFLQRLGDQFTDQPSQPPRDIEIWFIFVGRQPLDVTVHAAEDHQVRLEPKSVGRVRQNSMLQNWWRQFQTMMEEQTKASDYPPLVQAYLETVIQQRLGLGTPLLKRVEAAQSDPLTETWQLLTGAEALQVDNLKKLMQGTADPNSIPDQPMPTPIAWTPRPFNEFDPQVQIEEIASRVPQECFYVRFGTWANQVWLKKLIDEHGGDLSRMVRLRGYQSLVGDLFRDQLAMESGQLDDLFGGTLIQDVAVIGMDTFFSEGAAAGLILQSRNGLLASSLAGKRRDYAKAHASRGVTLSDIEIAGQPATILQSPDGRVRSILVSADNFHLVTTSYRLSERFLEAAAGQGSLGQTDEFRQARTQMPLDRDDTLFVYMSTAFLENLVSPHYQIELQRRLRSITEIQVLQLATWSAMAHQTPVPSGFADWESAPLPIRVESLKQSGFLPRYFNQRSDGTQLSELATTGKPGDKEASDLTGELVGERWYGDSIRGVRGWMVPVADMQVKAVTQQEVQWYNVRSQYFADVWRQTDPIMLGVKRFKTKGGVERVVFDGRIAPFASQKYSWLTDRIGPPLSMRPADNPDDVIRLELSLAGSSGLVNTPPHQLFAAVQRDAERLQSLDPTEWWTTLKMLQATPGYVASFPAAGLLDWFPMLGAPPDEQGYTRSRALGVWRLQKNDFSVVAKERERLERLEPFLQMTETESPAQARLLVADMVGSQLENWVNALWRQRSWQASLANTRLLHLLMQHFRMEPARAKIQAQSLLNAELICSLDGKYRLWDDAIDPEAAAEEAPNFEPGMEANRTGKANSLRRPDDGGLATRDEMDERLASNPHPFSQHWISDRWPIDEQALIETWGSENSPLLSWFRGAMIEVNQQESRFLVHGYLDIKRQESETAALPGINLFKGFSFK
jgi:hypothetical protein